MAPTLKKDDYSDGKLITLSESLDSRAKILDLAYAILFFLSMNMFAYLLITYYDNIMAAIFALFGTVAFAIGSYRFIQKSTEAEKLFVSKDTMTIQRSTLLKVDRQSFNLGEISNFAFNKKEKYDPHPLKGETFDYLGFQTEQQVIQDLHSDGRISFDYQGRKFRFGKDLASWDFDELNMLIYTLTGHDFRNNKSKEQNFG